MDYPIDVSFAGDDQQDDDKKKKLAVQPTEVIDAGQVPMSVEPAEVISQGKVNKVSLDKPTTSGNTPRQVINYRGALSLKKLKDSGYDFSKLNNIQQQQVLSPNFDFDTETSKDDYKDLTPDLRQRIAEARDAHRDTLLDFEDNQFQAQAPQVNATGSKVVKTSQSTPTTVDVASEIEDYKKKYGTTNTLQLAKLKELQPENAKDIDKTIANLSYWYGLQAKAQGKDKDIKEGLIGVDNSVRTQDLPPNLLSPNQETIVNPETGEQHTDVSGVSGKAYVDLSNFSNQEGETFQTSVAKKYLQLQNQFEDGDIDVALEAFKQAKGKDQLFNNYGDNSPNTSVYDVLAKGGAAEKDGHYFTEYSDDNGDLTKFALLSQIAKKEGNQTPEHVAELYGKLEDYYKAQNEATDKWLTQQEKWLGDENKSWLMSLYNVAEGAQMFVDKTGTDNRVNLLQYGLGLVTDEQRPKGVNPEAQAGEETINPYVKELTKISQIEDYRRNSVIDDLLKKKENSTDPLIPDLVANMGFPATKKMVKKGVAKDLESIEFLKSLPSGYTAENSTGQLMAMLGIHSMFGLAGSAINFAAMSEQLRGMDKEHYDKNAILLGTGILLGEATGGLTSVIGAKPVLAATTGIGLAMAGGQTAINWDLYKKPDGTTDWDEILKSSIVNLGYVGLGLSEAGKAFKGKEPTKGYNAFVEAEDGRVGMFMEDPSTGRAVLQEIPADKAQKYMQDQFQERSKGGNTKPLMVGKATTESFDKLVSITNPNITDNAKEFLFGKQNEDQKTRSQNEELLDQSGDTLFGTTEQGKLTPYKFTHSQDSASESLKQVTGNPSSDRSFNALQILSNSTLNLNELHADKEAFQTLRNLEKDGYARVAENGDVTITTSGDEYRVKLENFQQSFSDKVTNITTSLRSLPDSSEAVKTELNNNKFKKYLNPNQNPFKVTVSELSNMKAPEQKALIYAAALGKVAYDENTGTIQNRNYTAKARTNTLDFGNTKEGQLEQAYYRLGQATRLKEETKSLIANLKKLNKGATAKEASERYKFYYEQAKGKNKSLIPMEFFSKPEVKPDTEVVKEAKIKTPSVLKSEPKTQIARIGQSHLEFTKLGEDETLPKTETLTVQDANQNIITLARKHEGFYSKGGMNFKDAVVEGKLRSGEWKLGKTGSPEYDKNKYSSFQDEYKKAEDLITGRIGIEQTEKQKLSRFFLPKEEYEQSNVNYLLKEGDVKVDKDTSIKIEEWNPYTFQSKQSGADSSRFYVNDVSLRLFEDVFYAGTIQAKMTRFITNNGKTQDINYFTQKVVGRIQKGLDFTEGKAFPEDGLEKDLAYTLSGFNNAEKNTLKNFISQVEKEHTSKDGKGGIDFIRIQPRRDYGEGVFTGNTYAEIMSASVHEKSHKTLVDISGKLPIFSDSTILDAVFNSSVGKKFDTFLRGSLYSGIEHSPDAKAHEIIAHATNLDTVDRLGIIGKERAETYATLFSDIWDSLYKHYGEDVVKELETYLEPQVAEGIQHIYENNRNKLDSSNRGYEVLARTWKGSIEGEGEGATTWEAGSGLKRVNLQRFTRSGEPTDFSGAAGAENARRVAEGAKPTFNFYVQRPDGTFVVEPSVERLPSSYVSGNYNLFDVSQDKNRIYWEHSFPEFQKMIEELGYDGFFSGDDYLPDIYRYKVSLLDNDANRASISSYKPASKFSQRGIEFQQGYGNEKGIPVDVITRQYLETPPPEFIDAIAEARTQDLHTPQDPATQKAYKQFFKETNDQYDYLVKKGTKIEAWTGEGEPYANSKAMIDDVSNNNHFYYLPTEKAFGTERLEVAQLDQHLPLQDSGKMDSTGRPLPYNDVFKIVHDLMGHTGNKWQFGIRGEYNAFVSHAELYSAEAFPALAAETFTQNAVVAKKNYALNKNGDYVLNVDPNNISYAQQKSSIPSPEVMKLITDQINNSKKDAWTELQTKAYHGTPAPPFEKFSNDFMGKGEGFQGFGYGHYFTDQKSVAEWYKKTLAKDEVLYKGKTASYYSSDSPSFDRAVKHVNDALNFNPDNKDPVGTAIGQAKSRIRETEKKIERIQTGKTGYNDPEYGMANVDTWTEVKENQEKTLSELEKLKNEDFTIHKGTLIEVTLQPKEDEYLLHDKPLSEQPEVVKKFVEKYKSEHPEDIVLQNWVSDSLSGDGLYRQLTKDFQSKVQASNYLLENGIKGIKFLAGNARNSTKDAYNYVIFNPEDIKIDAYHQKAQAQADLMNGIYNTTPEKMSTSSMSPLLKDGYWSTMSAVTDKLTKEEGLDRMENLKSDLNKLGLTYLETNRIYKGQEEPSILIYYPNRDSRNVVNYLGNKYGQESVLHGLGGKYQLDYTDGSNKIVPAEQLRFTSQGGDRTDVTLSDGKFSFAVDLNFGKEQDASEIKTNFSKNEPNKSVEHGRNYFLENGKHDLLNENDVRRVRMGSLDVIGQDGKAISFNDSELLPAAKARLQQDKSFNKFFEGASELTKNSDGSPKIWVHGTGAYPSKGLERTPDFEQFDTEANTTNSFGTHFGTVDQAQDFVLYDGLTNPDEQVKPGFEWFGDKPNGERMIPAILNFKNPIRLPDLDVWTPSRIREALNREGVINFDETLELQKAGSEDLAEGQDAIKNLLNEKGYDAIIYNNTNEGNKKEDSVIVWNPAQIKSPFNKGDFSTEDPRILYAKQAKETSFFQQLVQGLNPDLKLPKKGEEGYAQQRESIFVNHTTDVLNNWEKAGANKEFDLTKTTQESEDAPLLKYMLSLTGEAVNIERDETGKATSIKMLSAPYKAEDVSAVEAGISKAVTEWNKNSKNKLTQQEAEHILLNQAETTSKSIKDLGENTDFQTWYSKIQNGDNEVGFDPVTGIAETIDSFQARQRKIDTSDEKLAAADLDAWTDLASNLVRGGALTDYEISQIKKFSDDGDVPKLKNFVDNINKMSVLELITGVIRANPLVGVKVQARNLIANTGFITAEEFARLPAGIVDMALANMVDRPRQTEVALPLVNKGFAKGLYSAVTKGVSDSYYTVKNGDSLTGFENPHYFREKTTGWWFLKPLEVYTKYAFRVQSAADKPNRALAYTRALEEATTLKARNDAPEGLSWSQKRDWAWNNLTPEEAGKATEYAEYAVFQNDNSIANEYYKFRERRGELVKAIMDLEVPYIKTPTNIFYRVLDYSGVYPLLKAGADVKSNFSHSEYTTFKTKLYDAFDEQAIKAISWGIGRGMVGWTTAIMGYYLAKAGYVESTYDETERKDQQLTELIGGSYGAVHYNGKSYDVSNFNPVMFWMLAGADAYKSEQNARQKEAEGKALPMGESATIATDVTLGTLKDMAVLIPLISKGVDIWKEVEKGEKADLTKFIGAKRVVPSVVGEIAQYQDPNKRLEGGDNTFLGTLDDQVKSVLPSTGISVLPDVSRKTLPLKYDMLGRPIPTPAAFDPFKTTQDDKNPVVQELNRFKVTFQPKLEGTKAEQNENKKKLGQMLAPVLDSIVTSPEYKNASDPFKKQILNESIKYARREDRTDKLTDEQEKFNLEMIRHRELLKPEIEHTVLPKLAYKNPNADMWFATNFFTTGKQTIEQADANFKAYQKDPEGYFNAHYKDGKKIPRKKVKNK